MRDSRVLTGAQIVQSQFDRAADLVSIEPYMRQILKTPFRTVTVEVPVRMDDGQIQVLQAVIPLGSTTYHSGTPKNRTVQ